MADTSFANKLQIKPGHKVAIVNAPEGNIDKLGVLAESGEMVDILKTTPDFVLLFANDSKEIDAFVPNIVRNIKSDGLFWIAYPKGGSKIKTDLNRDILRDAMLKYKVSGVSLVSLNEVWSAMRFRPTEKVGK